MKTKNYGFHLTLDGYFGNARALDDIDLIMRSYFHRVFGIWKVEKNIIIGGKECPRADLA